MQDDEELKEFYAYESLCINGKVNKYANKMGLIPNDSNSDKKLMSVAQEFIDFYEESTSFQRKLIRESYDFYFCVGLIGYYLSNKPENEKFKNFFFSITNKEMTKENGYQTIQLSKSENSYWFIETCKATHEHE